MVHTFDEHFFGRYPETAALVADNDRRMKSWALRRGGHDSEKLYADNYHKAQTAGKPVVILAHMVKGYKIPEAESKNTAHQSKKNVSRKLKIFPRSFPIRY